MKSADGETEIDLTYSAVLDEKAGKVMIQTEKVENRGNYKVAIELRGNRGLRKTMVTGDYVKVQTNIVMKDVSYSIGESSDEAKAENKGRWRYPNKAAFEDQATDDTFLHFKATVSLSDSKSALVGYPGQVHLSFKKIDTRASEQLQINALGSFDGFTFNGSVDFSNQFDLVNGEYRVQLVALDSTAQGASTWDLGTIKVWFKEGQNDANNQRMQSNYFPQKEIVAQFPPAD